MKSVLSILLLTLLFGCKPYAPERYQEIIVFDNFNKNSDTFYYFTDLNKAISCAKDENKKILLVFYGSYVFSNRDVEWKVLSQYSDRKTLYDNFVICWLGVDEPAPIDTSLAEKPRLSYKNTMGYKYERLQVNLIEKNSRPAFCIVDTNLMRIGNSLTYTKNPKEVDEFIQSGLMNSR